MNRGTITNMVGFALLAGCFLVALGRVVSRERSERSGDVVVRVAHWQLESGLRDAFDAVAKAYMEENPGVRVEQITVPERVYKSWLRTQLVGGTAPDIIEVLPGVETSLLDRFFSPLTEELDKPNPYNDGTELEGQPWRRTFSDGLASSYNEQLLDYYGIPISMFTVRVFYNKTLWREIFGDRPPPRTYEEFLAACEGALEFSRRTGRVLIPVSSSRYHGKYLTDRMFQSQTQKLLQRIDHARSLLPTANEIGASYMLGEWSLRDQAVRDGFQLVHEAGRYMQPGFNQLAREDGVFYFVQGRALMTSSGSWDASSLRDQAPFEVGAFPVPLPSKDHPRFGPNIVGPASEAGTVSGIMFAVTQTTPNREAALDFLRYFTSVRGNTLFMRESSWLPVVNGVTPGDNDEHVKPFMPIMEGAPPGFAPTMRDFGTETSRVLQDHFHRLVGPGGSVDNYIEAVIPALVPRMREDMRRKVQRGTWNLWRQDGSAMAYWHLHDVRAEEGAAKRWELIVEGQMLREAELLWMSRVLKEADAARAQ